LYLLIAALIVSIMPNASGRQSLSRGEAARENFVSPEGCLSGEALSDAIRTLSFGTLLKADADSDMPKAGYYALVICYESANLDLNSGQPHRQ